MKMRQSLWVLVALTAVYAGPLLADDRTQIEEVVRTAYIEGVHLDRDAEKMGAGFHDSFVMLISRDGEVSTLGKEEWIERIAAWKRAEPALDFEASGRITNVDAIGDAAVVIVEIHRDDELVFTDYLSLYRFEDGWKIVAKTFHDHRD